MPKVGVSIASRQGSLQLPPAVALWGLKSGGENTWELHQQVFTLLRCLAQALAQVPAYELQATVATVAGPQSEPHVHPKDSNGKRHPSFWRFEAL